MKILIKIVNACVVFGRKSGYSSQSQKVGGFSFPFEESDLLALDKIC